MADFDDLIDEAQGNYLALDYIPVVVGMTWRYGHLITDPNTGVPLDFTGCTATSIIYDDTGTVLGTPPGTFVTVTFPAMGEIWSEVPPALSATVDPGTYYPEVVITRVSDGAKVMVIGGGDSKLYVSKVGS